jgi:Cytidylate kinase-like family
VNRPIWRRRIVKRVEDIDRYLRAHFSAEKTSKAATPEPVRHPFVTISRQAGTGAHALGQAILDAFGRQDDTELFGGWQVYDRTLCEIVAKDPRFAGSLDSLLEEEYRTKTDDFFHVMLRSTVDQSMVTERVFLVVRTIARMGKAIIVGRGGSHVTKGLAQGISLRMVAPEDFRVARAMEALGLSEREARAGARKRDADRARLMRANFGVDIEDPTGYDMTWNIASASYEEIAGAAAVLVRSRAADIPAVTR